MHIRLLVESVVETTDLKKRGAKKVVDALLATIVEQIEENGRCNIKGFGVFRKVTRKARIGRNPKNQEPIQIPEKTVIKFRATY